MSVLRFGDQVYLKPTLAAGRVLSVSSDPDGYGRVLVELEDGRRATVDRDVVVLRGSYYTRHRHQHGHYEIHRGGLIVARTSDFIEAELMVRALNAFSEQDRAKAIYEAQPLPIPPWAKINPWAEGIDTMQGAAE